MPPLTSSSSIQQYVGCLLIQMIDHSSPPFVQLGYVAEADVSSVQPKVVQSLDVEVALSRQFRRLS
jgi:hypothetical protein